jgi:hypothetical protein
MNIQHTWVTPEQAAEWLSKNATNNRRMSKKTIKQYKNDMLTGNWRLTGEAIKFDSNGRLIDGQHRLAAIVAAKIPVEILIITGLEPDTIQVLDTGRTRSSGDALVISGAMANANAIAALARKIIAYQGGFVDIFNTKTIKLKGESITNREVLLFCSITDLQPNIMFAAKMKGNQVTQCFNFGEWAFLHWMLTQIDQPQAEDFLWRLGTLDNVPGEHTIRTLFEKITKSALLSPKQRLISTILAWNSYREGKYLKKIHVSNFEGKIVPL